jgi:hypothetical protein
MWSCVNFAKETIIGHLPAPAYPGNVAELPVVVQLV